MNAATLSHASKNGCASRFLPRRSELFPLPVVKIPAPNRCRNSGEKKSKKRMAQTCKVFLACLYYTSLAATGAAFPGVFHGRPPSLFLRRGFAAGAVRRDGNCSTAPSVARWRVVPPVLARHSPAEPEMLRSAHPAQATPRPSAASRSTAIIRISVSQRFATAVLFAEADEAAVDSTASGRSPPRDADESKAQQ